jgi:hypothetical protein
MAKTIALVLLLALFLPISLFAEDVSYYFCTAIDTYSNSRYMVYSNIVSSKDGLFDAGIKNKFYDWLKAYVEELCSVPSYEFSVSVAGPFESRSAAEDRRLKNIGSSKSDGWKVYDITRTTFPIMTYSDN